MSARTLSMREARAARMCAESIVAGRRANLLRDQPTFVEAVAQHLATVTGSSVEDARAELVRHHRALLPLPPGTDVRPHWWPADHPKWRTNQ